MNKQAIIFGICIVGTLIVVGLIIALVVSKDKYSGKHSHRHQKHHNFCGRAQNIGLQVNTDRALLRQLYNSGQLTENTQLNRGGWKPGPYVGSQFHQYPGGGNKVLMETSR